MSDLNQTISQVIAGELNVKPQQILAAMNLLDEGNYDPIYRALSQRGHGRIG